MAVAQIKRIVANKTGKGNVLRPEQVAPALDKDLKELAILIKDFIILNAQGSKKFLKDKSGFVNYTKVGFSTDGIKISLPSYAQYIDSGRKPGARKVPISALIKWIRRYRVNGRNRSSGRFKQNTSINSLAFAIQTSIFKFGTKAKPFITKSIEFANEVLGEAIEQILIPEILTIINFTSKTIKNKS